MIADGNGIVTLTKCHVSGNRAMNGSGGGLAAVGQVVMTINDDCIIANNSCTSGVGGGISVGMFAEGLRFGSMGRLDVDTAALGRDHSSAHVVISGSHITNNTSNGGASGRLAVVANLAVTLLNRTRIILVRLVLPSMIEGNTANSSGGAVLVMGSASFEADTTVFWFANSVPRGFVGSTLVVFENASLPWCDDKVQ